MSWLNLSNSVLNPSGNSLVAKLGAYATRAGVFAFPRTIRNEVYGKESIHRRWTRSRWLLLVGRSRFGHAPGPLIKLPSLGYLHFSALGDQYGAAHPETMGDLSQAELESFGHANILRQEPSSARRFEQK
jgi:hypothetical protein